MEDEKITQNALKALLYEVVTNPKPGLVDPADVGSHPDMDVYLFIDSSLSIENYFSQAVKIGSRFDGGDLREMFAQLRQAGIDAEKAMFKATNNVNTHKGAVFSLGLFVCAAAYCRGHENDDEFAVIQQMTAGLVKHDLGQKHETAGEQQFLKYGKGGVRAEAEAGYPLVRDVALPFLAQTSGDLNSRLLDTLMKIVSQIEDSNLIKRAGNLEVIPWAHEQAEKYLCLGGYQTEAGKELLLELNRIFKEKNYSLGGSADLLILTIFMGFERGII
ncbi:MULTISPECIES: triphosphoribosyl-dephospho-CoA synthase [Lactobacillus]|uniref:Probable 2-(5''-triphosphoribosyl)-3'-dephosphocoenzyme-A synthase n=1 Tax=Lactobacillus xujianguonis TaxID=2495899 RepID=A0A437SVA2_9LACO|nr:MULTISPECIES: triphosphoribosyl-dephospho-CoA synthase [Lactobacillus]RVU70770.1 triphosphoribosyl-dephospho-CoA synthase [Lactobacillus xujianguonis]RVU73967.1 triphosphoribosyl-dephospho-CoA synthase [Lactobacillus xujianguonis]